MSETKRPIRIGIVGAGANTCSRHIPGLRAQPGVEIVCVVNSTAASSQRVAAEQGIAETAPDWRALVARPDLDAIVIGTWPVLHCPVSLAALATGKHVLTEARMAMNAAEARLMLEASRQRPDLVAQIVPSPFTFEVDRTVQRLLREGYLGRLLTLDLRVADGGFVDPAAPLTWRQDADRSGLNVMTLGIWYESLMRWVGEASSVMARGRTFVSQRQDETGRLRSVRVPDHLSILADLACGAQATLTLTAVAGAVKQAEVLLCGTEGTLRFADGQLWGARRGDDALRLLEIPAAERGAWRVEEEFISAIRGRECITHTRFEDGLKYMLFTEAVALSMAERREVVIPMC
ncbi:Gfo/Idh/MocA family protein [Uliginosibacterium paludis]|uniref:Gfo/Idh/MocA family oxidoreductase n=1 Tax=Uliginosibacterium paludis TaxID=1615952 RepID=A0ABV2CPU8_9RHOO